VIPGIQLLRESNKSQRSEKGFSIVPFEKNRRSYKIMSLNQNQVFSPLLAVEPGAWAWDFIP